MVKPAIELYDKYAKWVDLGTIATAYATSSALPPYYEKNPYSVEVFLRIIPPRMK